MKRILAVCLIMLLAGSCGLAAYWFSAERYKRASLEDARDRLSLYSASLQSALTRLSHLPTTVSLHPDVVRTIQGSLPDDAFSAYLESVADAAGSAILYVMNADGDTVSASNYRTENSFVSKNYAFRPYFTAAMTGSSGTHYAVGATTGIPGYFVSQPIYSGKEPAGVAVVKVEFEDLLRNWQQAGERVLVTDRYGIIILTSIADWHFKTIRSLTDREQTELAQSKKFSSRILETLPFESEAGGFSGEITIDGNQFVVSQAEIGTEGWAIHYLTGLSAVTYPAVLAGWSVFLLSLLSVSAVFLWRFRTQQNMMALQAKEAERIRAANQQLEREVRTRQETEDALRRAQSQLVQAGRLAALGKMSAAIVHEVNQPVAAIRTFTASGELLLKKKKLSDATEVLGRIRSMTDRLASITSDLLLFSRRTGKGMTAVDVNACVKAVAQEVATGLEEKGIALQLDLEQPSPLANGNPVRLEQLVSNMLRNAVQAIGESHRQDGSIRIETTRENGHAILCFQDNGCGMSRETLDQLFEPFFTTKNIGEGVGLGLAICYAIADEAGGTIRADNRPGGGAEFVVSLPLAVPQKPAAARDIGDQPKAAPEKADA